MNTIIDIQNLNKVFEFKGKQPVKACNDINLAIYEGEFLSIVGESGSGKSTLIKIISNLESKTSGKVMYDSKDLTELKGKNLRLHRKEMQLLFQDTTSALNPKMKVEDIICEPLINFKIIKKSQKREKALEYLKKVELDETFLEKKPNQMSGGQRQRIGIARALTLTPKILLLDEPTSALDVITQNKIITLLKSLQKENNLTIVFVCHDIALVTKVSDRIAVMQSGTLKEVITPTELLSNNVNEYTKQLIESVFDIKKCGCRFDIECIHEEDKVG